MKSDLLKNVVDNLLNKLYSFAHAIVPDELQAEQLVIDSYSIFLVKHKRQLTQMGALKKTIDNKFKIHIRNYVFKSMLQSIYDLGLKRSSQLKVETGEEFSEFFSLSVAQRAAIHLQEVLEMNIDDIRQIVGLNATEALEYLYKAQSVLTPRPTIKTTQEIQR